MLLTIDLGNTSIKLGLFENNEELCFSVYDKLHEDYRSLILSFLFRNNKRENDLECVIFSCVVPNLYDKVYTALKSIVEENKIIDINPNDDYGIKLDVPNPSSVGDDLIVMSAYAYHLFKRDIIIVSIGTVTVISHVDATGNFKHCIIAPGFNKVAESIWGSAAQLPEFELQKSNTFLADNTIDAMNVGTYNGYIGMLEYLVNGLKNELNLDSYIVGCGGVGKLLTPHTDIFDYFDSDLVTKGLNYIYETKKNK